MKSVNVKAGYFSILLITTALLLGACSKSVIPGDLPGTYTGKERVIIRYDRGGQYIFRDEYVMVSLMIDSTGHVTGMVGEATLVDCIVNQNRGWIERQLGIKTDFLIKGFLKGNTFDKDTLVNKEISIPFNILKGELKGSLFMNANGDTFPIISVLKLQKW
jgi:hypothetical protein